MNDFHGIGHISRKQNMAALIICVGGVLVNLFLNTLVNALGLPLYLDTVGTVAAAAIGGISPECS